MSAGILYRDVKRMAAEDLERERALLGPLIRDIVNAKQVRLREISSEIERRQRSCRAGSCATKTA